MMQTEPMAMSEHGETGWRVDPIAGVAYGRGNRWTGGRIGSHGYRVTTIRGRAFLHHRVIWEACVGPIPPGMVINHKNGIKTDNRLCNLEVVTSSQNNQHAMDTGLNTARGVSGARNWNYRVTPEMHAQILSRIAAGETGAAVAQSLGLSANTISRVRRGVRCPS